MNTKHHIQKHSLARSNHGIRRPGGNSLTLLVWLACGTTCIAADSVRLETLNLSLMRQGYGKPAAGKSVAGKPMLMGGKTYTTGVGTHAHSTCWIDLGGGARSFHATVGVDGNCNGPGSVIFRLAGDDRELWQSGIMKAGDAPKAIDIPLAGVQKLQLEVTDAGDGIAYDHANWADARFEMTQGRPKTIRTPGEELVLLTPKPGPAPRINGPTIYGATPGNPFLYRIPCQGARPVFFSAVGLPATLKLDPESGIITGTTPPQGLYRITIHAKNAHGKSTRLFRLCAGEKLALTPPMGWNHWYVHYDRITDKLMREAADAMVSSSMADVGYQYVNIDDCWMNAPRHQDPMRGGPLRDARGEILPNKHFPDMQGLTAYIHAKGLKAGIYTSPGRLTCAGFSGSYGHEERDAATYAAWGFDFVKYDWCSYGDIAGKGDPKRPEVPNWSSGGDKLPAMKYPYQVMGDALKRQPRDMILNHCQYGMGNVWEWGAAVGGHCWRTAGDLGFELDRITEVAINNARHRAWNGPGSWNDPDYIQIGLIGNARGMGNPEPCPLTPNQQYSYMSLWCLSAAPLFFSGDMGNLDEFTLNVLCNPDLIEVNQDALGQCGEVIAITDKTFLMVKDLEDGGKAVGFFNRGDSPAHITAPWPVLGLHGPAAARDLWCQRELGVATGSHSATVPAQGVMVIRFTPR